MSDIDKKVVAFFLSICSFDDAEEQTCTKFGINTDKLNLILHYHFTAILPM